MNYQSRRATVLLLFLFTAALAAVSVFIALQFRTKEPLQPGPGPGVSCKAAGQTCNNDCCSGLVCQNGIDGTSRCEQPSGEVCPGGGVCGNQHIAFRCTGDFGSECNSGSPGVQIATVSSFDEGLAFIAGCGQVDQVCSGGSKDRQLCGNFRIVKDNCTTTPPPPSITTLTCDQACGGADTQCADGLTCDATSGKCRLPANPQSPYCALPQEVVCNQPCDNGITAFCPTGLTCTDIGGSTACRLASNPTSASCTSQECGQTCGPNGECPGTLACASDGICVAAGCVGYPELCTSDRCNSIQVECGATCYLDLNCGAGTTCSVETALTDPCLANGTCTAGACQADNCLADPASCNADLCTPTVTPPPPNPECGSTCETDSECPNGHSCNASTKTCILTGCTATTCTSGLCAPICGGPCIPGTSNSCPVGHSCDSNNNCVKNECLNNANCTNNGCLLPTIIPTTAIFDDSRDFLLLGILLMISGILIYRTKFLQMAILELSTKESNLDKELSKWRSVEEDKKAQKLKGNRDKFEKGFEYREVEADLEGEEIL